MADPCDSNWSDVVLLLDFDGANGSTTFTDLSDFAHPMTSESGGAITTTNPKFGVGALNCNTVGYVDTPIDSSLDLPAAGDFTIEFWVRLNNPGAPATIEGTMAYGTPYGSGGIRGYFQPDGLGGSQFFVQCNAFHAWDNLSSTVGISDTAWHAIAIVRDGTTGKMFLDGVLVATSGSSPWSGTFSFSGTVAFGFGANVFDRLNGAIDEVRVTRGLARYTTNYTPATEAFPLTQCIDPAIVPDVVGETLADATTAIETALLVVGVTTFENSDTVPEGEVISQDPVGGTSVFVGDAVDLVLSLGPQVCEGVPFEGYISWPYLDFGILGIDKMLEGFDIVADGTFRVSFGYSQRDFSLATADYTLDGDTVTGSMVPMPLTAPSFQMRITFNAEQAWEWFASTLYINNEGTG